MSFSARSSCLLCQKVGKLTEVSDIEKRQNSFFIHEFKHSVLLLGEHQFFLGYCQLITKVHYREMSDLPPNLRNQFFQELMIVHELIERTFSPHKMNLSSLGNVVDHIHWHFFPRYKDEPHLFDSPWVHQEKFQQHLISSETARSLVEKMKEHLIL